MDRIAVKFVTSHHVGHRDNEVASGQANAGRPWSNSLTVHRGLKGGMARGARYSLNAAMRSASSQRMSV